MLRLCTDRCRRSLLAVSSSQLDNVSWSAVDAEPQKRVAADVVYYVAKTHIGLVELPEEVDRTVDKAILNMGLRGKRLRFYGQRLLDHLRTLARSQNRGGIFGWSEMQARRSRQRRKKELAAWIDACSARFPAEEAAMAEKAVSSEQTLSLPWKTSGFVTQHAENPGVLVETPSPSYEEVTTAAFAATRFAAVTRIFEELRLRLPTMRPRRMLDFGSGMGTAIWAAQEVWKTGPNEVLAVEPSISMASLSREIERAVKAADKLPSRCVIRRVPRLPLLYGSAKRTKRQYDFVVVSYVLCEISSSVQRRRIVRQLWHSCADVLVIVEPGTPVGAANVQEARTMLLEYEKKRAKKQMETRPQNGDLGRDPIVKHRLESAGIHVVAPCPHDGPCPMTETNMWCHFSQRFQRTRAQRVTKLVPSSKYDALKVVSKSTAAGSRWGPRDFQDERFSYVVMRRGWRNEVWEDVQISPHFYQQVKPDNPEIEWTPNKDKRIVREREFFEGGASATFAPPTSPSLPIGDRLDGSANDAVDLGSADDGNAERGPAKVMGLDALSGVRSQTMIPVDDAAVQYPEHLSEIKYADWSLLDPRGLEDSRQASARWSRIIRHPRRKTGHVVLDVCSSCTENAKGECVGRLQRHIITRSDRNREMGDAGYIMAKKARWGDLWPTYYNSNQKITNL